MRDSSLPSPDHSCNTARPVSLPCDDLMTQICTMSSPLSGSSWAYCSEPLILLSATRTPTQAQTSCFFRIFFTFFQNFSCLRVFYHIFDGFITFCHSQFINIWYNFSLDTLPRLKSWDSTSTRPLADPVLRLSVTAWCPIRESIFTQGSPFELIPYGIY